MHAPWTEKESEVLPQLLITQAIIAQEAWQGTYWYNCGMNVKGIASHFLCYEAHSTRQNL